MWFLKVYLENSDSLTVGLMYIIMVEERHGVPLPTVQLELCGPPLAVHKYTSM